MARMLPWSTLSLIVALVSASAGVFGQTGAVNGEWRTYGGDLGAHAMRRSIRSMPETSASCKSRGASRPTSSAPGPTSTCRRRP